MRSDAVLRSRQRLIIVLVASVLAGAPFVYHPAGCKFLEWVHGAYARREFVGLKGREIRSFVYVQDVVSLALELARRYLAGDIVAWEGAPDSGGEDSGAGVGELQSATLGAGAGGGAGLVLNVGGPRPQSRLQVAQSLCGALGSQLVVAPAGEEPSGPQGQDRAALTDADSKGQWRVYVMDEVAGSPNPSAGAGNGAGELRSPRDLSMDSTPAERLLGRAFRDTDSVLLECLAL